MSSVRSMVLVCASLAAGVAQAQSDPSGFDTVYNIGTVPPGSIFDVAGAVTGTQVGDGNDVIGIAFITPTFLGGDALDTGSQLNLFDGGQIIGAFVCFTGTEINVTGGMVDDDFQVIFATVNISGGTVGDSFNVDDSTVNISAGTIGADLDAGGATINISGGLVGDDFDARAGTVHLSGGSVANGFEVSQGCVLTISGGSIGDDLLVLSTATITGGSIGANARASGVFNLSGGSVGEDFVAEFGSEVTITGGTVGDRFTTSFGGTTNISGGSLGDNFNAIVGATVNITGASFALDGVELDNLELEEANTITDRDVTLTGVLVDGSPFEIDLNSAAFNPGATLALTRLFPIDANDDGVLDSGDILAFIQALDAGSAGTDLNMDGESNFFDLLFHLERLGF